MIKSYFFHLRRNNLIQFDRMPRDPLFSIPDPLFPQLMANKAQKTGWSPFLTESRQFFLIQVKVSAIN